MLSRKVKTIHTNLIQKSLIRNVLILRGRKKDFLYFFLQKREKKYSFLRCQQTKICIHDPPTILENKSCAHHNKINVQNMYYSMKLNLFPYAIIQTKLLNNQKKLFRDLKQFLNLMSRNFFYLNCWCIYIWFVSDNINQTNFFFIVIIDKYRRIIIICLIIIRLFSNQILVKHANKFNFWDNFWFWDFFQFHS